MRFANILLAFTLCAVLTPSAQGQGNSQNARGSRGNSATRGGGGVDVDIDVTFGADELRLIRAWFGNDSNLSGLPPGLAKRETLPPGLQRQLQRNGTLPPGLQDRVYRLPSDLERGLPDRRPGTSRVVIGGHIVLLEEATSLILDVVAIF